MGSNFAENHPLATGLLKGGLTGVGQGLQQQNNPNPQFNFSQLQQGFAANRPKKPPMQTGINGNQSPFPKGPDTSIYG